MHIQTNREWHDGVVPTEEGCASDAPVYHQRQSELFRADIVRDDSGKWEDGEAGRYFRVSRLIAQTLNKLIVQLVVFHAGWALPETRRHCSPTTRPISLTTF